MLLIIAENERNVWRQNCPVLLRMSDIHVLFLFARNSENMQVVDTALIRTRAVCEVDLV